MKPRISRVDLHIHTVYSDGQSTVGQVIQQARAKKLSSAAVTDHFSEVRPLKKRMDSRKLVEYLEELEGTGLIRGVEVDLFKEDKLIIAPRRAEVLDLVLGGVHNIGAVNFWDDPQPVLNPERFMEEMRLALISGIESKQVDIIVHPTWLPEALRPQTETLTGGDWRKSVIDAAADKAVAFEISGAWNVPDEDFARECLRNGVKLSMGSDAHRPEQIGRLNHPVTVLRAIGAEPEDIFTLR